MLKTKGFAKKKNKIEITNEFNKDIETIVNNGAIEKQGEERL